MKFKPPEIWTTSHSVTDKERNLLRAFLREGFKVELIEPVIASLMGYEFKVKGCIDYKRRDGTGFEILFFVWIPRGSPYDYDFDFDALGNTYEEEGGTVIGFMREKINKALRRAYSP